MPVERPWTRNDARPRALAGSSESTIRSGNNVQQSHQTHNGRGGAAFLGRLLWLTRRNGAPPRLVAPTRYPRYLESFPGNNGAVWQRS